jgi:hypothetical protein
MLMPPEGVYATIPVCRPTDWVHAVEFALSLPTVEALRRRLRVAGPATVLAAAREWANAADHATGRNVAVSHATVAARIGYAEATVKRIMRFLNRLGFVIECARGRNRLTLDELATARALGAPHQRAAASTRALTIPKTVDGTPLPTPKTVNKKTPVKKYSPTRAKRARKADAPRRPAKDEDQEVNSSQPRWPLAIQRFAAQLVHRLPRLLRTPRTQPQRAYIQTPDNQTHAVWVGGRHIGHICHTITRHQLIERGWTVNQLLEHIDHYRTELRNDIEPTEQRDPLAWLSWLITQTIPPDQLAPHAHAQAERAQRHATAQKQHAAEQERRALITAQQPEIDTILANMHRQFAAAPQRNNRTRHMNPNANSGSREFERADEGQENTKTD